jgi:hypothetical protein
VLFGATSSVVLVTQDGGRRWSPVQVPGVAVQALSLGGNFLVVTDKCSPTDPGYPNCGPSKIVSIPLGSDVVASVHTVPRCAHWGSAIAAGTTLLALGCDGVFRSKNGGATWERVRVRFKLADPLLAAHGSSDLWALNTYGGAVGTQWKSIYRSLNGGATWHLVGRVSTGTPLLGPSVGSLPYQGYAAMLLASSAQHVLLFSNRFGVSATFDGGRLWVSPASASGVAAGGITCVGPNDCWAGSDSFLDSDPVILRTINGGRSWLASKVG